MFIIIRKNPDGTFTGGPTPCIHPSYADAHKEAARLAYMNRDSEFLLMQAQCSVKAPPLPAVITTPFR